jgi:hypothetical protein
VDKAAMWIRGLVTLALFGLCAWWLVEVSRQVGSAPVHDADGLVLDRFERSKDILLVVLPLLGTALGYWFGAAGRESAEGKARQASADAESAHQEARQTEQRLSSVLATSADTDLLKRAREQHPEAFGLSSTDQGGITR